LVKIPKGAFMIETLSVSPQFAAFLLASLILAVIPGPAVIYIVTRTLSQGRSAGLASVCGIALGNLGNAAGASLGLAAILAASSSAFVVVKLAGAGYLVFLGIRTLQAKSPAAGAAVAGRASPAQLFRSGFFVALLNPKTALFFAALLPQFIDSRVPVIPQSLGLGFVFISIAACTDTIYVLTAAVIAKTITRQPRLRHFGRYLSAATFFGLGLYAALANPRAVK
jgi:threonine/homoserine/homoserine lactone efflux protein